MIAGLPIRLRLTAAFAVAMGIVFSGLGAFLYLRLGAELDQALDQRLRDESAQIGVVAREEADDLQAPGESPLADIGKPYAEILTPSARLIDASPPLRAVRLLSRAQAIETLARGEVTFDRSEGGGVKEPLRVRAARVSIGRRRLISAVGVSLEEREDALASLAALLLVGGPLGLLLASGAGYAVAAGALRPVEAMRRGAASVSVAEPGERLPVPAARDELARLGRTLNDMLERQEAAFGRERAFVADASHELRTPLAVLRAELELALRAGRSPAELVAALRSATEETDRLARLAEDLLVIARADQGHLVARLEATAADGLLDDVRRRFVGRFADEGRELGVEVPYGLTLRADPPRLEQALDNMLENALLHGEGAVSLRAEPDGQEVRLAVTDGGPGFPAAFLASAFERFARADPGRSGGGAGLGLAVVAAVARAHGGRAGARNRPGRRAEVWLSVPSVENEPAPAVPIRLTTRDPAMSPTRRP